MVKNPPCNAGDTGSIPGWGSKTPRAPEELSPLPSIKTRCSQIIKLKKKNKKPHHAE